MADETIGYLMALLFPIFLTTGVTVITIVGWDVFVTGISRIFHGIDDE